MNSPHCKKPNIHFLWWGVWGSGLRREGTATLLSHHFNVQSVERSDMIVVDLIRSVLNVEWTYQVLSGLLLLQSWNCLWGYLWGYHPDNQSRILVNRGRHPRIQSNEVKMYTCTICHSVNHPSRVHCQNCGAIPSRYSITGRVMDSSYSRECVAAIGCKRATQHHQRLRLWTVETTYYAEV